MTAPPAEDLLDALRAIREALALPLAATAKGREVYAEALKRRAWNVEGTIDWILDNRGEAHEATAHLRRWLAAHPVPDYVTSDEAQAALAAGKMWAEATRRASTVTTVQGQAEPDLPSGQPEPDLETPTGRYPELMLGGEL